MYTESVLRVDGSRQGQLTLVLATRLSTACLSRSFKYRFLCEKKSRIHLRKGLSSFFFSNVTELRHFSILPNHYKSVRLSSANLKLIVSKKHFNAQLNYCKPEAAFTWHKRYTQTISQPEAAVNRRPQVVGRPP